MLKLLNKINNPDCIRYFSSSRCLSATNDRRSKKVKSSSSQSPPGNPLSRYDTPLTANSSTPETPEPTKSQPSKSARSKSSLSSSSGGGGGAVDYRMALIVRTDLKMDKGKIAAQCAHAAVSNFRTLQRQDPTLLNAWEYTGQAKVALKCNSLSEMETLAARAGDLGIWASFVRDAGRTQVAAGEITVLGLGPARRDLLDRVTKDLKLY